MACRTSLFFVADQQDRPPLWNQVLLVEYGAAAARNEVPSASAAQTTCQISALR
jgi:hypothetical protein